MDSDIELTGAYLVLFHALNLKRIGNNLYSDNKSLFCLTKFGFMKTDQVNKSLVISELTKENIRLSQDINYLKLKNISIKKENTGLTKKLKKKRLL